MFEVGNKGDVSALTGTGAEKTDYQRTEEKAESNRIILKAIKEKDMGTVISTDNVPTQP